MNEFADMSWEEFSKRLGAQAPSERPAAPKPPTAQSTRKLLQTPPATVDWVAAGKVTAIRNQGKVCAGALGDLRARAGSDCVVVARQGWHTTARALTSLAPPIHLQCAGCWAFAAIAALESLAKIKNATTLDMSEQQLLDCAGAALGYSSMGCATGSTGDAFNYVFKRSVGTEANYPFASGTTGTSSACSAAKIAAIKANLRISTDPGYYMPDYNSRSALMTAVASRPTVAYFNANKAFQLYKSGIFPAANCSDAGVNHAMLVVGYDTTGYNAAAPSSPTNTGFWRFKNSWGGGWGEAGFGRVQMLPDGNGACAMYQWGFMPANLA